MVDFSFRSKVPTTLMFLIIVSSLLQVVSSIAVSLIGLSPSTGAALDSLSPSLQTYVYLLLWPLAGLISPVAEEFVFRKSLWGLLSKRLDDKQVLVSTSLIFAVVHIEAASVIGLLPISFFLGWLRLKSGGILAPVVSHCSYNIFGLSLMMLT